MLEALRALAFFANALLPLRAVEPLLHVAALVVAVCVDALRRQCPRDGASRILAYGLRVGTTLFTAMQVGCAQGFLLLRGALPLRQFVLRLQTLALGALRLLLLGFVPLVLLGLILQTLGLDLLRQRALVLFALVLQTSCLLLRLLFGRTSTHVVWPLGGLVRGLLQRLPLLSLLLRLLLALSLHPLRVLTGIGLARLGLLPRLILASIGGLALLVLLGTGIVLVLLCFGVAIVLFVLRARIAGDDQRQSGCEHCWPQGLTGGEDHGGACRNTNAVVGIGVLSGKRHERIMRTATPIQWPEG